MTPPRPYRHLFGPVPSRRLGRSLGIDLVPHKVCSLDCRYCECGATTTLTCARREWVPTADVLAELDRWLAAHPDGGAGVADHLTFSGAGEPTLHRDLGRIAAWLAGRSPVPLVLLTNGTLLGDPALRAELAPFAVICPSLDAATEATFRALNRPHPSLTAAALVDALAALRREVSAEIWLEVLLAEGVNDRDAELDALAAAIARIDPHRVQVNTAVRPGTDPALGPASAETLARALARFGSRAEPVATFAPRGATRASAAVPVSDPSAPDPDETLAARLLAVVSRRPDTLEALALSLAVPEPDLRRVADALVRAGRLLREPRDGRDYLRAPADRA